MSSAVPADAQAAAVARRAVVAEFLGTAVMIFVGLSAIAVNFGDGSPVTRWLPDPAVRRFLTGCLFAGGGTAVVYSPLGMTSGGHLNPAVTFAFWLTGKIRGGEAVAYVIAQVAGAFLGAALARAAWGPWAASTNLGVTGPGTGIGWALAFALEAGMTAALIVLILTMVMRPPAVARYTGLAVCALVVGLVFFGAPFTGTGINPARSLAPAVLTGNLGFLSVYLVAPLAGAALAVVLVRAAVGQHLVDACAKLFHPAERFCHLCFFRLHAAAPAVAPR